MSRNHSASLPSLIWTPPVHWGTHRCVTAWRAWTTGPTATWPGRWSWTAWETEPGSTTATVALLRPCLELSAPSTTPSPSSRAPWTACTNWTPQAHSQRNQHPPTKVWWRNQEAAALLSKVGTHSVYFSIYSVICTASLISMDRWIAPKILTKPFILQETFSGSGSVNSTDVILVTLHFCGWSHWLVNLGLLFNCKTTLCQHY